MAQGQNKLVGTQYLDLTRLKKDVSETNNLLKSIGTNVNLNMTDVVEKQVKAMLTRFKSEIQKASQHTAKSGSQMANGLKSASTQIQTLLTATQKLNADGTLTETRKGYDALGKSIAEVYKNGQLLSRTMDTGKGVQSNISQANQLYQQQLTYLRQLNQLSIQRLSAGNGTSLAAELDLQIATLQQQINGNKQLISQMDQQVVKRSKLVNLAAEEARLQQKLKTAQASQQTRSSNASETAEQKNAEKAYRQLTNAYRQYNQARKNGDQAQQAYWSQSAQSALNELNLLEQKLPSLNLEQSVRQKILDLINQAKNAETTHQKQLKGMTDSANSLDAAQNKMGSRLLQMATTMLVLRGLTSLWRNATEYAQQYYDKLNEIRIVTGKTQAEVQQLGQRYRAMAKEMKVASTEIATAANEFWRQGLDESEVDQRLKASIQYAKISAMEFDEAAEQITAATNTMNVSAQRVADVFAYLGDASASGPDEIGVAMQKASASAEEFGLTFEWLGAYIATISEKTRQAPEVIGTSLNSIMARLHSVKAKGFNDEDETKINDVAKALNTIDVALLDNEGNWRAMSDIFSDIAIKWDELDDKQRAYIATTMAGTRQQNYFLALMNDMALGLEGGSRAYELYYGALGAAGTATEKYAIWQESVTASQNRLNAAMESFYALLNAEWMKGFYEGMAGLVEIITAGTDALGGWNLLIPAIAVGVTGLIAVVYKAVVAFKAMQAAIAAGNGMAALMSGGTIGAILAAVAALATVVTMIVGASQSASEVEEIDYGSTLQSVSTYRDSIDGLVSELETLASKTSLTAEEQARADQIMETLSGTSLSMKTALEGGADGFDTLGQKAAAARGEVEKTEQALRNLNAAGALQNLRDTDNAYGGAIGSAQAELQSAGSYGTIAELYAQYIAENPTGLYRQGYAGGHGTYVTKDENFYTYAVQKTKQEKPIWLSREEKERIQADRDLWAGIVKELDKLGIDAGSSVDEVKNKMLEFDIAMGSIVGAAEQELAEAWQPVFDDLYTVMTDGTSFSQLPQYLQQTAIDYYDAYIGAVDQQKALAEGELMVMASDLTNYVNQLFAFMSTNPEFTQLMAQFDELYAAPRTNENVAALNALLPAINGYIEAYNALTADTSDDIPLLTDFIPADEAEQAAHSMSLLSEGLESYFAQMKEKRDAAEAEENLYADQVAQLRSAWEQDDGGAAFADTLNTMHSENETMTKGLLETHTALMDMASGTMSYEDGLAALTAMEKLATTQAQEHTAELIAQAEAEKELEAAQADHYAGILQNLNTAYASSYADFMTEWNKLSDEAKAAVIELYPEVAALATVTGESADGAAAFAAAIERAAATDLTAFKELLNTGNISRTKTETAQTAKDQGYKDQLLALETALSTGGVEGMRTALFDLYTENETLYNGLMETYSILCMLGDATLTQAQAADVLSEAYRVQTVASAAAVQEMRDRLALEDKLSKAADGYYVDTLRELQQAYHEGGSASFHTMWDTLDTETQEYILRTYTAVGDLAVESVDRTNDVVDGIFENAIADALAMKETLLRQSLVEGAEGYSVQQQVDTARENGFQDQLVQLRSALEDGTFIDVLTGFGEDMTEALLAEHDWLNSVIEGLSSAEEGTYSLTEATALLDSYIVGTQEHFLANVESLNEANAELLATEEEQITVQTNLMDALSTGGIEGFRDEFNALGEEMQQAILEESPALKKFFRNLEDGAADSEQAIDDLDKEIKGLNLKKLQRDGKVWDDVVDAMEDAGKGGKDFTKSYGAVIEQVEGLNEAMGALTAIQNGSLTSAEDLTDAYDVLASYTGVSADALRNNLDPAIWAISSDMDMASMSASYLCNWLWSTAGVTFSAGNWQAQLAALAGSADATTANVARLVQTMLQCAGASLSLDGDTIKVNWGSGSYTPPSARSSGSRSSGGGGSSKSQNSSVSVSSDIEKMLDKMDGVMDIEDHRRQMAQLAQDYHDARGEIQGVLLYLEKERAIVLENSGMLETYIATLETQIEAKKKILAQNAEGSTQYQQAMADLAALQEQHQEYSEQLLQNKIDLEELEQAMEDQRDAIRDMEIDLRELIHEAIMDREELERSMLEGRIEIEEEILDVLTRRYEEERDQLLELAEVKREALNNELTLLDEQLEARKRLNEEEDRAALLAEKEAQLARIAADPTRKKEELALREEIAELREEIAWDLAEKEVDAQKEAIEAQITSIDDYIEYVEGYYEELLANPRKLMEEMQNLLTSTDADILAWLEKNHQDYQTATDATRQEMSQGWQDMLDQMRGHTQTYWDEVESIIAQGDDAIIQFLMDNSADYKEAGHLQAAAYVDEWKQQLEDLRNAYKQVAGDITTYDYTPTTSTTTSDSSSSSSSSSSSTKKTKRFVASGTGYAEAAKSTATSITYSGAAYIKDPKSDYWYKKSDARLIDAGRTYYWKTGTTRYVKKYLEGGLATGTGLAWVDGSTSRPERILSPYQTELFEDLLKTLHSIRTIQTPAAVVRPHLPDQQQPSYHIDSITVQVQKLESEQDYEEMAERVGEHIMNKVSRGMTVGGIRLG